ncbi:MAG TPA: redoxin domain-containing protein [Bacteroidota bacterium]|nr:redoxin domain-containing protein [Bacteroidota bacterium]
MTVTEIRPQTVRAHELFGDFWFNSEPMVVSALRGRAVIVYFWDFTCVSSLRVMPYVKEWHRKYQEYGLVVIGVHTPKFPFGKDPERVQRAIERHALTFPVVMDNEATIAARYGMRSWPSIFLVDKHGFVRYESAGEGNYTTTERVLQALLYDTLSGEELPLLMEPLREEDRSGAVRYRCTPELFAGYLKGSIGNVEGYSPESTVEYADPRLYLNDRIYAVGVWRNDRTCLVHTDPSPCATIVNYHATEVDAVFGTEGCDCVELIVTQDDRYLTEENRGEDVFLDALGRSVVRVNEPRRYQLVRNPRYGEHLLRVESVDRGFVVYSFMFVSGIIPELVSNA